MSSDIRTYSRDTYAHVTFIITSQTAVRFFFSLQTSAQTANQTAGLCVKLRDIASWQCQVAPRNGYKSGSTLHLERVLTMNIGKLRLNYLKPSYLIALQKVAIWSSSIWKIFSSEEHLKNPVICWCDLKFDVMKVAPWREIRKTQTNLVPNQIRRSSSDA